MDERKNSSRQNLQLNKEFLFLFFIFSLVSLLLLPIIFQYGIFFDGALYGAMSKNLSESIGTFWNPLPWKGDIPFHGHPPLGFFLQSLFFSAFGSFFFTEGLYGIFCFLITAISLVFFQKSLSSLWSPWPILLYISIPVVHWACRNNMLENTLVPLTLLACSFYRLSFFSKRIGFFFFSFVGSLLIVLSFGVKGPPGLFPLCVPFWCFVFDQKNNFKKMLSSLFLNICFVFILFFLIYQDPQGQSFFHEYVYSQIIPSLQGKRESSGSHFTILIYGLKNIWVPVLLILILKKITKLPMEFSRNFYFFLALGASAVLPYMATSKQMNWYLMPSLPFFSLALFEACKLMFDVFETYLIRSKHLLVVSTLFLYASSIAFSFFSFGKVYKNREFFDSFLPILGEVPPNEAFGVCTKDLAYQWDLVNNLNRYARSGVKVYPQTKDVRLWIRPKNRIDQPCFPLEECVLLNAEKSFYQVFRCSSY